MPHYEYRCSKAHKFEIVQKINDNPKDRCIIEGCSAKAVRLISLTNFKLKGSGWGKDGYSKENKK